LPPPVGMSTNASPPAHTLDDLELVGPERVVAEDAGENVEPLFECVKCGQEMRADKLEYER